MNPRQVSFKAFLTVDMTRDEIQRLRDAIEEAPVFQFPDHPGWSRFRTWAKGSEDFRGTEFLMSVADLYDMTALAKRMQDVKLTAELTLLCDRMSETERGINATLPRIP